MEGCRICGGDFFPKPLLTYDGAPRAAQGFLNVEQLVNDAAVNLKIWQCTQCGTVQHNLSPVDYYREVIRSIAFSPEMRTYRLQQLGSWLQLLVSSPLGCLLQALPGSCLACRPLSEP